MLKLRKRLRRLFGLKAPAPGFDPGLADAIRREPEAWRSAVEAARGGPRVLMATSVGGFSPATTVEGLLAAALTLRGAEVHLLLCDRVLPACQQASYEGLADPERFAREGPGPELCDGCFASGEAAYAPLGLPFHLFSDLVDGEQRARAEVLAAAPLDEGLEQHALAGALRFYARGTLEPGPEGDAVMRRYRAAAILTRDAMRALFRRVAFESAVFHHGIYVPQGVVGEVARELGVRVVNWHVAYRKRRFIFSHHETYHHTLVSEPTAAWEHLELSQPQQDELMAYLKSRWQGTQDWIGFHERPVEDAQLVAQRLGIDPERPCVGMLTNVLWDARLHYRQNAFPDIVDWAVRTIEYFARRPELQLVIRVHPAEVRGTLPSRQPIEPEIRRAFARLPANVFVIPAASNISTYAAMLRCDSVIVYGTKMGVELTALGIPVIVAGEAWIKHKGLTLDASTPEEYFALLDRLPLGKRMDEAQVRRARLYAYHFFFRRMIPLHQVEQARGFPPYRVALRSLQDLLPGRSQGLDVICDGILKQSAFVYPAESAGDHE